MPGASSWDILVGLCSSSLNTNNSKILRRSFQFPTSVVFRVRTVWACQQTGRGGEERGREPLSGWQQPKMADFDAIYEDQDENSSILEAPSISLIPDPVIVRGAGNITVWVVTLLLNSLPLHVTLWLRSPLFVPGLDSQTASTQNFPTCCTQGWRQKSSRYNLQKRQFAQFSQNVTSWQPQNNVAPKSLKYTNHTTKSWFCSCHKSWHIRGICPKFYTAGFSGLEFYTVNFT